MASTAPAAARLTTRQTGLAIIFGAILWFLAALLMRAIEPLGALEGSGVAILYLLVIPGTVPFVLLLRKAAGLRGEQTALGVTIATGTAALLDGAAFAAIPSLYGANGLGAAAAILWGAGVALVLGVVMSRG